MFQRPWALFLKWFPSLNSLEIKGSSLAFFKQKSHLQQVITVFQLPVQLTSLDAYVIIIISHTECFKPFMKTYWDVVDTRHCNTTVCFNFVLSACSHSRASDLFSLSAFVRGFCVNLEKEVTAGGSANRDTSQWGPLTLEYESLQISRVFVLALIHSYAIASNTILPIRLFFSCASLILLLHPLSPNLSSLSLSSTLLSSHHSRSAFLLEFPSTVELKAASLSLSVLFLFFFYKFLPSYQNNQFNLWLELYTVSN